MPLVHQSNLLISYSVKDMDKRVCCQSVFALTTPPAAMIVLSGSVIWTYDTSECPSGGHLRAAVAAAEAIPVEEVLLSLDGLRIADADPLHEQSTIRVSYKGIVGGKGGFGAQLRSLAKQRGKKRTTNFGACRDLSGRRLKHINDEIILNKWADAQSKGEAFKADAETPSGIDLWFLSAPSWADKVKIDKRKRFMAPKLKTDICLDWKRARERGNVPEGVPIHWGCPRGSRCEFAHGESDLRGTSLVSAQEDAKAAETRKYQELKDAYMAPMRVMKDEQEVADLVSAGLRAAKRAKTSATSAASAASAASAGVSGNVTKPLATPAPAAPAAVPTATPAAASASAPVSKVELVAGQAMVERTSEGIVITSNSSFCSILLPCAVSEGKWFYEMELLSDGLMQVGWASDGFACAAEGDGVGDDAMSWAYDGYRSLAWHNGSSVVYGPQTGEIWSAGDILTASISIDGEGEGDEVKVTMAFARNGLLLGDAFTFTSSTAPVFYPALSLEQGESIAVMDSTKVAMAPADNSYLPVMTNLL